jgi:hypothetical protein
MGFPKDQDRAFHAIAMVRHVLFDEQAFVTLADLRSEIPALPSLALGASVRRGKYLHVLPAYGSLRIVAGEARLVSPDKVPFSHADREVSL